MKNTNAKQARIALPEPESMTPEQLAVYNAVISGPRGVLVGPLRAALLKPELASRWQKLGETLRYNTSLPKRISELAIIATARRWNSDLEWIIHAKAALAGGLSADIVNALEKGLRPTFVEPEEGNVYDFARELLQTGSVNDTLYEQVRGRWSDEGVMELTAIIGYYSMVAMTLNAHQIPLPENAEPVFLLQDGEPRQLTELS
ncbi:MAG: carboxymuconolactone decarboxylase family protein [Sulfitobacter sp.]